MAIHSPAPPSVYRCNVVWSSAPCANVKSSRCAPCRMPLMCYHADVLLATAAGVIVGVGIGWAFTRASWGTTCKLQKVLCFVLPPLPPPPPHASPPHVPVSSSRNLLPPSGFCFSDAICQIKLPWYCTALVLSCLPHCAHIIVPTCCAWYSTATVSCQSRVGAQQPGPPPIRPVIAPKGKERELSMRLE